VAIHDVDLLPSPDVQYLNCSFPTYLSSEMESFNWGVPYGHYCGGVFIASPVHWKQINGMTNLFWGWGGEYDELFSRLSARGLLKGR